MSRIGVVFAPYQSCSFIAVPLVLALGRAGSDRLDPIPPGLEGFWVGDAMGEAGSGGGRARRISVSLWIAGDGRVAGTIGSARLVDGYLTRNRGAPGCAPAEGDFLVRGKLDGALAPGRSGDGQEVLVPFDVVPEERGAPRILGKVTTWGSACGRPGSGVAASDLILTCLLTR